MPNRVGGSLEARMDLELGQDVDVRPNPRVNSQVTLRVGIGIPTKHRTDKGQIGPPARGAGHRTPRWGPTAAGAWGAVDLGRPGRAPDSAS